MGQNSSKKESGCLTATSLYPALAQAQSAQTSSSVTTAPAPNPITNPTATSSSTQGTGTPSTAATGTKTLTTMGGGASPTVTTPTSTAGTTTTTLPVASSTYNPATGTATYTVGTPAGTVAALGPGGQTGLQAASTANLSYATPQASTAAAPPQPKTLTIMGGTSGGAGGSVTGGNLSTASSTASATSAATGAGYSPYGYFVSQRAENLQNELAVIKGNGLTALMTSNAKPADVQSAIKQFNQIVTSAGGLANAASQARNAAAIAGTAPPVDQKTFMTNAQITFGDPTAQVNPKTGAIVYSPDAHSNLYEVTETLPDGSTFIYYGSTAGGIGLGTTQAQSAAISSSLTINKTYAELGQNITLSASAYGGIAPYQFNIYDTNGGFLTSVTVSTGTQTFMGYNYNYAPIYQTIYGLIYKTKPINTGNIHYRVEVLDAGSNESNSTASMTVNSTPRISLSPKFATIPPYTNITFSNITKAGTPPYTYSYTLSGGASAINNTVTFTKLGSYSVELMVKDSLGFSSNATALITAAYLPSIIPVGDCIMIANMSQDGIQSIANVSGQQVTALVNYITPTYAGITIDGHSTTLNFTSGAYVPVNGFYVDYLNYSWAPILHTITIEICPSPPITTSISTTSTSTVSTIPTTVPTTSIPTTIYTTVYTAPTTAKSTTSIAGPTHEVTIYGTTSIPSNSISHPSSNNLGTTVLEIIAAVIIAVVVIILYKFKYGKVLRTRPEPQRAPPPPTSQIPQAPRPSPPKPPKPDKNRIVDL